MFICQCPNCYRKFFLDLKDTDFASDFQTHYLTIKCPKCGYEEDIPDFREDDPVSS